jgi:hypothetical protein
VAQNCCYGKYRTRKTRPPEKAMMTYLNNGKSFWKVVSNTRITDVLSTSASKKLLLTELSGQVDADIIFMMRTITVDRLRNICIKGYSNSPWQIRASNLTSLSSLMDCFDYKAEVMDTPIPGSKSSCGSAIHGLLEDACTSGLLGSYWQQASSRCGLLENGDRFIVPIQGNCDAVYRNKPVELKTVDNFDSISMTVINSWLMQVAIYQLLYPDQNSAILVIVARETYEIKSFEINYDNIENVINKLQNIISLEFLFFDDCFRIASKYYSLIQTHKPSGTVSTGVKPFLAIVPDVENMYVKHTIIFHDRVLDSIKSNQLDGICHNLQWFYRCYKRLPEHYDGQLLYSNVSNSVQSYAEGSTYLAKDYLTSEKLELVI